MKCPVCSAELPATAKFCGSCGTTLSAPPSPSSISEAPYQPAAPVKNAGSGYAGSGYTGSSYGGSSYGGALPSVPKKYKVLRLIAVMIKVLAFIAGGLLIIVGLVMLVAGAASSTKSTGLGEVGPAALFGGVVGALIMLIYGVMVFIFLYGYAEFMYVLMDIEENTRVTNEALSGKR
ncbi:MAG: zinc ribbon domain-containing protein [Blastocatellia bacterium]